MSTSTRGIISSSAAIDCPIGVTQKPFWRNPALVIPERLSARMAAGFLLIILLLSLLGWLYLDQAALVRETTQDVTRLRSMRTEEVWEVRYLQAELAEQTSMARVLGHATSAQLLPDQPLDVIVVRPASSPENLVMTP